jgi:hypothetical protein
VSAKKQPQGGVIPPHNITINGKLVNADVNAKHIDELQGYAATEKFDLESECQSRYAYGSDWLTVHQLAEITHAMVERRDHQRHAPPLPPLPRVWSGPDALRPEL